MISPDTITRVKERTDIVALVGETVKLVRRGRSFTGLCPFHKEKTPSFHVNPERGMFYCFGCKEAGGAVDFIMKTEGHSFPEAVRWLAERAGVEVAETATDQERREAHAARRSREDLYAVNNVAATFFERQLRGSSAHPLAHHAVAELARRALAFPAQDDVVGEAARVGDTLQAFRIGYAPFGWDALATYFRQQGIAQTAAERVGLLVPRTSGSGHYDRFRHRLMFAVSDVMGRVIAFSGRALPEPTPLEITTHKLTGPTASAAEPPAKYINSPESPIYTKGEHLFGLHQARQAIRQTGEALLVEGNFDVVALHARGVANVVAPLGTAFTPQQAKLLKRFAPRVTILFDGDRAGRKATLAAHKSCREGGLDASVAALPKDTDPDEFVRTAGSAGLEKVLKAARGMREFRIQDALDGDAFRTGSLDEQQARLRAVQAILSEESDPTVRAMVKTYADRISSKLVVAGKPLASLRELELALEGATRRGANANAPDEASSSERPGEVTVPHDRARSRSQTEAIPLRMLGALLDFPHLLRDADVEQALDLLDGDAALAVAALRQNIREHANGTPPAHDATGIEREPGDDDDPEDRSSPQGEIGVYADEFLAQIAPSIQAFAVGRLASPTFEVLDDARTELLDNARKLSSLSLKRENAVGVEQLQRVEATGDVDKENELLRALDARARRRHGLVPETRLETKVFPGVTFGEPRVSSTRSAPQTPPGSFDGGAPEGGSSDPSRFS